tara:strand:+ start:1446 stop:2270 length:825 start_codon:yes stop_codon:yes gene_type:complete
MKLITKTGSHLEVDMSKLDDDLRITSQKKNNLWCINREELFIKDIVLILNDKRKKITKNLEEENIPTHDLYIYLKDAKNPFKIENINKENIEISISENTDYDFELKFSHKDINFYVKEEYITGLVLKSKKLETEEFKDNKLFISLENYEKLIEIENNQSIKKIQRESELIIYANSLKEEAYFKNVKSFWLNKNIETGNFNYVIGLKNNKKIYLKNKNKINYHYEDELLKIDIKDESIIYSAYSSEIDYIRPFEKNAPNAEKTSDQSNKMYIKDI